jgi:integrase
MPSKSLTDVSIRNLKPRPNRYEVPDTRSRGLYAVIQPSGKKGFAVRYRFAGQTRKLTLQPGVTLAAARKLASDAMLDIAQGRDPALARQTARAAADAKAKDTVANLAGQFLEKYAKQRTRPQTWKQYEGIFARIVLPAWRGRTVHEIKRRDVIELVERVAEGTGNTPARPILANRTLGVVRKFFSWLAARDVVTASPCTGVVPPGKERARDRTLSDDEVVQLWRACDEISPLYGAAIRLLLLTGARRNEIAELPWSEIDPATRLWTLSAARAKNHRANTIPLSTQAWRILENVPQMDDPALVFGHKLNDFGRAKIQLDRKLSFEPPWQVHDLRRTAASGLQKVGTPIHVTELILNHRSGAFKGVVGVYQRHDHAAEKAAALQRWADRVEALVSGKPGDNVVALHG